MQCPKCMTVLQNKAIFCNSCGASVTARLDSEIASGADRSSGLGVGGSESGISVDGPQEARTASEKLFSATAISIEGPPSTEKQVKRPVVERPKEPLRPVGWRPKKNNVKAWATTRELNHYEMLELDETASDEIVQERMNMLAQEISNYASDLDGAIQELGKNGRKRFSEMKVSFADRPKYNEEARQERHQREIEKIRKIAQNAVAKDKVLQWREWVSLQGVIQDVGVSPEELEQIIGELKTQGALTGVTVADKEVRTILEMKDACAGRGYRLVDLIWNGELERWLDSACERPNLAEDIKRIKQDYQTNKRLGAQVFLWSLSEDRIILHGPSGEAELTNLQAWIDGVLNKELAKASSDALEEGLLEYWFKMVLKREDHASLAVKYKGQGPSGIIKLIEQMKAVSTGQLGIRPFRCKHGEVYSLTELIDLCDKHPDDAQAYLFDDLIAPWLVGTLGEAELAQQANALKKSHSKRKRKGLELFVRELCKVAKVLPFPQIFAEPNMINIGEMPMGSATSLTITLKNKGRGYAWGDIALDSSLPGVTTVSSFDGLDARFNLQLDTVQVEPGLYRGNIVVRAEGVPDACVIPLQYEVKALDISVVPSLLDLGTIPHGKSCNASLTISCAQSMGRILGAASIASPASGLNISEYIDGSACEVQVLLTTSSLEAGRKYRTSIWLNTNAGNFQIPVEFQTKLRWDIVTLWTAGVSLATGLVMFLVRYGLASGGRNLGFWLTSYGGKPEPELLVPCGLFAVLVIGSVALVIWRYRERKAHPRS